jgi:hypothetical protein
MLHAFHAKIAEPVAVPILTGMSHRNIAVITTVVFVGIHTVMLGPIGADVAPVILVLIYAVMSHRLIAVITIVAAIFINTAMLQ